MTSARRLIEPKSRLFSAVEVILTAPLGSALTATHPIPVQIEGRSAVLAMVTIANTDAGVAMQAPPNPRSGQVVR
jgi:hypothetical protein